MNNQVIGKAIEILLVEDNPGDVRLTQEAFKEGRIQNRLNVVCDGKAALSYLKQEGDFAGMILPDLILLDLNIPKKDGRQVLKEIKEDDELKHIPVVILTASKAEEDILRSYDNHASCFIIKPVDLYQFLNVVKVIENFWLTIVKLPNHT